MRLFSLTLLFLLVQTSLISQIYLSSQSDVDEFNINHPSSTLENSLFIRTDNVSNLDSLYNLVTINGFLIIKDTKLEDLEGLNNLKQVNTLTISGNSSLDNIDAILDIEESLNFLSLNETNLISVPNFEMLDTIIHLSLSNNSNLVDISNLNHLTFDRISLFNNESLSDCSISSICDHLINFKEYNIVENGPDCNNREEILANCDDYDECTIESPDLYSDFDIWNKNSLPESWDGMLDTATISNVNYINITQVNSINEIEGHSVNLTTISDAWFATLVGEIKLPLQVKSSFIDISFEYCFADPGINSSTGKGSLLINNEEYWNTGFTNGTNSPCDNPKVAKICNLPVLESDSIVIELRNNLYGSSTDGVTGCSWIIDDFKLSHTVPNGTLDQGLENDQVRIFPIPVHNTLTLEIDIKYDRIKIIDLFQTEKMDVPFSYQLDVSDLQSGVYFLLLMKNDAMQTMKFIKN